MEKLIEKLSSYNIFTNLFPGIMYCYLVNKLFGISLVNNDLIVSVFFYYFCGMVISRFGSVLIEPILKKVNFIAFTDYKKYVEASSKDENVGVLLEASNSYRSIVALLTCVIATGVGESLVSLSPVTNQHAKYIMPVILLILFLLSYRKQTKYIVARVEFHSENMEKNSGNSTN
jgi:hypothetical protein